jgi:E3 ubiquitin-protein ligase NEDD4
MNPDLVDSDVLGLTFAREVAVFGSLEVMELLPGGRDVAVDSKNRGQYIDLLIQDMYVNSTRDQLNHFAEGFSFMLIRPDFQRAFFHSLDLEDLDKMLGGHMNAIDVQEWKEHTTYLGGYSEQDDQINWFWKVYDLSNLTFQLFKSSSTRNKVQ